MIVKIGNKFTDSKDEPIMIILEPYEKNVIGNMGELTKFACFPDGDIKNNFDKSNAFMKDEKEIKEEFFNNK